MADEPTPDSDEPTPDSDKLLDQIAQNTRTALRYARLRFLATWLAVGLLAILTAVALGAAQRNAKTDADQTEEIAVLANDTADQAAAETDDITRYLRGEQGIPGVPGTNGQDGTPGLPSSEQGPQGEPGPKGDAGITGPFGPAGPLGPLGPEGPKGIDGTSGSNGEPGTAGTEGSQGPKGDRGDEGPRGAEGPTGATGPQGPAGPPGDPHQITTTVAIGQSVKDTTTHKVANAECPAGARATGGGFAIVPSDPGLIPTASSPVGNTGWSVTVDQLSLPPGTEWQVLAFVTCVS